MTDPALYPCFLGPYGENNELLERLVIEFLRDHVYWQTTRDQTTRDTHKTTRDTHNIRTTRDT
ncbi:MAG: hypothetical protein Q8L45_13640 [Xanthomonadaceae bacterium]|nr:hypothetical protein [Xanthomonadaceae bacterium]